MKGVYFDIKMKQKPFEYYFSDKELLKILSRKRALLAKKEHDKLFHKRLITQKSKTAINELYEIFPPRNKWIRISKKERNGKNALEINAIQLERTVLRLTNKFKKIPSEKWEINLHKFLKEILENALNSSYLIPTPVIKSHFKEEKNEKKIFRPIASFDYKDRIVISQLNKYLTHCLDSLFLDCSYAFRSKEVLGKSFSHHKAVEDIIEFKRSFLEKNLWVAEYDIRKFFDVVNHDIVKEEFSLKVAEAERRGIKVENRAIDLFNSYLDCYSFNNTVKTINLGQNKEFGWVEDNELLSIGSNSATQKIGVPQGGAISTLIANIIMDKVDRQVMKNDDGKLFYARFCDDMVLIHPEQNICNKVLADYSKALKKVKLIGHKPSKIDEYSKEFWKSKSKEPYQWGDNVRGSKKTNVPWLSFVGYQISPDLQVRVRKSSIKNEITKQIKETGKVVSLLRNNNRNFRISEKSIKHRVRQRLLAMSVGRINIFDLKKEGQMCWTSGFRVLKENNFNKYQIKKLDRKRNAQLSRLSNHISNMSINRRPERNPNPVEIEKEPKYYGAPFSYYNQFIKK